MKTIVEVIDAYSFAVRESPRDAIAAIERVFATAQYTFGTAMAVQALATAFVTAEYRRRALEGGTTDRGADDVSNEH